MTPYRPRTLAAATLLAAAVLAGAVALMSGAPAGASVMAPATTPTIGTSPSLPNPPADLHVTAVTSTSVTLAWTAPTPTSAAIEGYNVSYNQAYNDIYWMKQIGNVTSVTITDSIRPTGQYSFRVATRDTLGHTGLSSNTVVVVTPASDTAADQSVPSTPADLRVTTVTSAGAVLNWTGSTDNVGVTGYNVYRFDGLYVSTLLGTTTATTFTAPMPSAAIGSWYVRAVDAAGNLSATSNAVTAPITTTTPPAQLCKVAYRNGSQWQGGFVADVTVTNLAATAIDGWTLALTFGGDQRVTSIWNASVSQSGNVATITSAGWNRKIAAGGTASFGLMGSWRTSNAAPTQAVLNGAACQLV
jgi:cellulose 1,4-beta-cellobiosidase